MVAALAVSRAALDGLLCRATLLSAGGRQDELLLLHLGLVQGFHEELLMAEAGHRLLGLDGQVLLLLLADLALLSPAAAARLAAQAELGQRARQQRLSAGAR